MRGFILILSLTAYVLGSVAYSLPKENIKLSWDEYKQQYNKFYASSAEELSRRNIYEHRLREIEQFNNEQDNFKKGINHLTDLTDEEYSRLNGLRVSKIGPESLDQLGQKILDKVLFYANRPTYSLPETVDWTTEPNRVGPVKDQGGCGSCWAFATVGVFEGQEYRNSTSSNVVELSEQNLVDCDNYNLGCEGGQLSEAVDFVVREGGLMTERDYPYLSGSGTTFNCSYDKSKSFVTTWGFKKSFVLPQGDEQTLQKVVAEYGPVAVGMDASSPHFRDYTSGVYYDENCVRQAGTLNHGVLVVGYGTDEKQGDYWLIKNSWSNTWGESGYFKLARNRDNHCGVADAATIAV